MVNEEKTEPNSAAGQPSVVNSGASTSRDVRVPRDARVAHAPPPGQFRPSTDNWAIYQERLEQYFVFQDIMEPENKKAMIISVIGNFAYGDLRNMCAPNSVSSKSYDELCALLQQQYADPENVHFERKKFYAATRNGEPVQQLLLRLKGLATPCKFGAEYHSKLLDKVVTLQEDRVFDRICEEDENLTLDQAIKIIMRVEGQNRIRQRPSDEQAHAIAQKRQSNSASRFQPNPARGPGLWSARRSEATPARNTSQMRTERTNGNQRPQSGRRTRCIHCGGTNHSTRECLHKVASCHICKQQGHIATICPRRRTNFAKATKQQKADEESDLEREDEAVNLDEAFDNGSEYSEVYINNMKVNAEENSQYLVTLSVSGRAMEFQIDTGAGISAISLEQYRAELPHVPLMNSSTRLYGYTGEQLFIAGAIYPNIQLNKEKVTKCIIYIVHKGGPPLLGRRLLNRLKFSYEFKASPGNAPKVHNVEESNLSTKQIQDEFAALFDGTLGLYNKKVIRLEVKPEAQAKFVRARPVPFAFQKQYDDEFDTLERLGVITRTDTAEWGTPVVPVLKPNGKIRICGDYKTTLNPNLEKVQHPLPKPAEIFARLKGGTIFSKLDLSIYR